MQTIKFVRCEPPNDRDFRVLIDGEHRATFRSQLRYGRAGYDFQAPDHGTISRGRIYYNGVTKADFPRIVQEALDSNAIPTLAQIERVKMIDRAEKENRQWVDERNERRSQMKRSLIAEGLSYLLKETSLDAERRDMAESLVKRYTTANWDGWF